MLARWSVRQVTPEALRHGPEGIEARDEGECLCRRCICEGGGAGGGLGDGGGCERRLLQ